MLFLIKLVRRQVFFEVERKNRNVVHRLETFNSVLWMKLKKGRGSGNCIMCLEGDGIIKIKFDL